jgi:hypothetical protein
MRHLMIALAAAAVVGLALASAGHAAPSRPAARDCGLTPRIDGQRDQVQIEKGKASCRTVMRVVTKYLRTFKSTPPWHCFLGHGSSPYAASCSGRHGVVVRVYAPG